MNNKIVNHFKRNELKYDAAIGFVMIGVSFVSVAIGATKASKIIYAEEVKKKRSLTKKEKFKLTWSQYVPAVASFSAGVVCLGRCNVIYKRTISALNAAYKASDAAYKLYKAEFEKDSSTDKIEEIKKKASNLKIPEKSNDETTANNKNGSEDVLCYDPWSDRYYWSTKEKIHEAVNRTNKILLDDLTATLNDFYYHLGLPETKSGNALGWRFTMPAGMINFDAIIEPGMSTSGKPCLIVDPEPEALV